MGELRDRLVERAVEGLGPVLAAWRDRAGHEAVVSAWIDRLLARCHDLRFGQRFAAAFPIPGLSPGAYLHRVIDSDPGPLLAGIRFKGGDPAWPFVDLLASDLDLTDPLALEGALACLAAEFSAFAPRAVRVLLQAGEIPGVAPDRCEPDQAFVAGPLRALQAVAQPRAEIELELGPPTNLSWVADYRHAMERFQAQAGALGAEVATCSEAELAISRHAGALVVARWRDGFAGLVAARPGRWWALDGFEVIEQLLVEELRGHRLGPIVQRALIDALPAEGNPLLWGTIHALNAASHATARRCGRQEVGAWWFVRV